MSRDRNRNPDRRRDRDASGANDSRNARDGRGSSRRPRRRDRRGRRRREREQEERSVDAVGRRRLGVAFVLLVGLSGGTMALQGGASLAAVSGVTVASLVAGGALLWYLYWIVS